ncbi:hypothetical protein ACFX14_022279 [Malus domestica]
MAHISVEEAGKEESGRVDVPEPTKRKLERVYTGMMVFSRLNLTLANHLKPIYVIAYPKGVPFKRVLIDGEVAVNMLPFKHMKRVCRNEEDLIPTDLTVSSFSRAITKTHGILNLEVNLGSQ